MIIDVSAEKHKHGVTAYQLPTNPPWAVVSEHVTSVGIQWFPIALFWDEGQARGFCDIFANPQTKVFARFEGPTDERI